MKHRESFFSKGKVIILLFFLIFFLNLFASSAIGYFIDTLNISGNVISFTTTKTDHNDENVKTSSPTPTIPPIVEEPIQNEVITELFVKNEDSKYLIKDLIINGGFEDNTSTSWNKIGEVGIVSKYNNILPHEGVNMLKIGGQNLLTDNLIEQIISTNERVQAVGFWYQVVTQEDLEGFDEPFLLVYINDEMVFRLDKDNSVIDNNDLGWKEVIVALPENIPPIFKLKFYAGNTGDENKHSIVLLDNISTNYAIKNDASRIFLKNKNREVTRLNYRMGNDESFSSDVELDELYLDISMQPEKVLLEYWNENKLDSVNSSYIYFDNGIQNEIDDLIVRAEGNREYSLSFTSPQDNDPDNISFLPLLKYEVKYSYSPISPETSWDYLLTPEEVFIDAMPGITRSPRTNNKQEVLILSGIQEAQYIYFAIRAISASGKLSKQNVISYERQ